MSIDAQIAALIAALAANTAALEKAAGATPAASTGKSAAAAAKDKAAGAVKEDAVTQEQMNAALVKIKDDFGMEHAKEVIVAAGGVQKMAEIKPAKYKAVFEAAVAKHAELTEGAGDGGM